MTGNAVIHRIPEFADASEARAFLMEVLEKIIASTPLLAVEAATMLMMMKTFTFDLPAAADMRDAAIEDWCELVVPAERAAAQDAMEKLMFTRLVRGLPA